MNGATRCLRLQPPTPCCALRRASPLSWDTGHGAFIDTSQLQASDDELRGHLDRLAATDPLAFYASALVPLTPDDTPTTTTPNPTPHGARAALRDDAALWLIRALLAVEPAALCDPLPPVPDEALTVSSDTRN